MEDSFKSWEGVGQRMSNPLCHIDGVMILRLRADGGGDLMGGMAGLIDWVSDKYVAENGFDFDMGKGLFRPEVLWV
jgi:hypothetical protein